MTKPPVLLVAIALLTATGCASIEKSMTIDQERKLAAAGFQMKFATTPAQMAKTASLPQHKLTPAPGPDGKTRFIWADATDCKCIYVGTPAAYDRYRRLQVEETIAENEEAASMEWGGWGVWGPWY